MLLATPVACMLDAGRSVAPVVSSAPAAEQTWAALPPPVYLVTFHPTEPVRVAELAWAPGHAAIALASQALAAGRADDALSRLTDAPAVPAAALIRARAARLTGRLEEASRALESARVEPSLADLVSLEAGLLAHAYGDDARAIASLEAVWDRGAGSARRAAVLALAASLAAVDPARLLSRFDEMQASLPSGDRDARSKLLGLQAVALEGLGRPEQAMQARLRRYLEEPVSPLTPSQPPVGIAPTPQQRLERAERLLEANRNSDALEALNALSEPELAAPQRCRLWAAMGLAARKQRRYDAAEHALATARALCADDEEMLRRASFLHAKVISIHDGLRAIGPIEAFAQRFSGHSMVDDVLFWAGDMYQRRDMRADAEATYARVESLPIKGDHCGEARWRLAWMAYQAGELDQAARLLERVLLPDLCVQDGFDRARARYWLARVAQRRGDLTAAAKAYEQVQEAAPLSYYGAAAMWRLMQIAPARAGELQQRYPRVLGEAVAQVPPLCPDTLAEQPAFLRGVTYLLQGLADDATQEFLALGGGAQDVLGGAHAAALGLAARPAAGQRGGLRQCGGGQALLLLATLLDAAGAHQHAHWRVRTDFASELSRMPSQDEVFLWRLAYPPAYRSLIDEAEHAAAVPSYFLQALVREESAFDPAVVSWAGAYGLTQLLPSTAREIGAQMRPRVAVRQSESLLDPRLNIKLGAALLGDELRRYRGFLPLALAAYNAGAQAASRWWRVLAGEPADEFAEEINIRETRGYVQRVLRTYAVYAWLYGGSHPALIGVDETVPLFSAAQ